MLVLLIFGYIFARRARDVLLQSKARLIRGTEEREESLIHDLLHPAQL